VKLPFFALRDHVQVGGLRGSNDLYNMLYVGFAWGEVAQLILSGPGRWQGEQFSVARQVPGAPYTWAAMLFVASVALAVGVSLPDDQDPDKRSKRAYLIVGGALVIVVWCALLAWCLFVAGQRYPTQVSFSGPYLWSFFAFWYMVKVGQHLELKNYELRS
jgi:hypothetical protein